MIKHKKKVNNAYPLPNRDQARILYIKDFLKSQNLIAGSMVGVTGAASPQWLSFNLLLFLCNIEEFLLMTESPDAAIKIYGFFGLAYNNYNDLQVIRSKLLIDNSHVQTMNGCFVNTSTVSECVLNLNGWVPVESVKVFQDEISNDIALG